MKHLISSSLTLDGIEISLSVRARLREVQALARGSQDEIERSLLCDRLLDLAATKAPELVQSASRQFSGLAQAALVDLRHQHSLMVQAGAKALRKGRR